jgi:hypothetical protein
VHALSAHMRTTMLPQHLISTALAPLTMSARIHRFMPFSGHLNSKSWQPSAPSWAAACPLRKSLIRADVQRAPPGP